MANDVERANQPARRRVRRRVRRRRAAISTVPATVMPRASRAPGHSDDQWMPVSGSSPVAPPGWGTGAGDGDVVGVAVGVAVGELVGGTPERSGMRTPTTSDCEDVGSSSLSPNAVPAGASSAAVNTSAPTARTGPAAARLSRLVMGAIDTMFTAEALSCARPRREECARSRDAGYVRSTTGQRRSRRVRGRR